MWSTKDLARSLQCECRVRWGRSMPTRCKWMVNTALSMMNHGLPDGEAADGGDGQKTTYRWVQSVLMRSIELLDWTFVWNEVHERSATFWRICPWDCLYDCIQHQSDIVHVQGMHGSGRRYEYLTCLVVVSKDVDWMYMGKRWVKTPLRISQIVQRMLRWLRKSFRIEQC